MLLQHKKYQRKLFQAIACLLCLFAKTILSLLPEPISRNYVLTSKNSIHSGRKLKLWQVKEPPNFLMESFLSGRRNFIQSIALLSVLVPTTKTNAETFAGKRNIGGSEWSLALPPDWKIVKKLDSTVRIRSETVLIAQEEGLNAEIKINKVPLGMDAIGNFSPEDQLVLSSYFTNERGNSKSQSVVLKAMQSSLESQVASPKSALKSFTMLAEQSKEYRDELGHRYVMYGYIGDKCVGPLDYDGYCEDGYSKRKSVAVVTVALELQARTSQERRLMELGELERREIEVLWICCLTAPEKKFIGSVGKLLEDIVGSFEIISVQK